MLRKTFCLIIVLTIVAVVGCGGGEEDDGSGAIVQQGNNLTAPSSAPANRVFDFDTDAAAANPFNDPAGEQDQTVDFGHAIVHSSPVRLEYQADRNLLFAVTDLPPTEGDIFVLMRVDKWAHPNAPAPEEQDWIILTIPRRNHASLGFHPNRWIWGATTYTVEPVEEFAMMPFEFGVEVTAEKFKIHKDHKFIPYKIEEDQKSIDILGIGFDP